MEEGPRQSEHKPQVRMFSKDEHGGPCVQSKTGQRGMAGEDGRGAPGARPGLGAPGRTAGVLPRIVGGHQRAPSRPVT